MPDPQADLLTDLDDAQRTAVVTAHAPLAIIAPAGSGKTTVLARRIAYRARAGTADARYVLALTFTRRAAAELSDRLRGLGVDSPVRAGTFHATALAQLRRFAVDRGREPPQLIDRKARLIAPLVGRGRGGRVVNDVIAEIEWAKARLVAPDEFAAAASAAGRHLPRPAGEIANVYERYEAEKRTRRLLDFDDVLRQCADAIARDPEFGAAQRFRFRHFFVDEFQDTTPLQLHLLRQWLGDCDDLSVVGDPAQAIYAFAGADASPLADFGLVFRGGRTIALTRNYRSTTAVVGLAETALGSASGAPRTSPDAARGRGPAPTITAFADAEAEAVAVAAACRRAFRGGTGWRDMAVLFRTNAQAHVFEEALDRRGVPYRSSNRGRFDAHPAWPLLFERLRAGERAAPRRPFAEHLADLAADDDFDDDETRDARDELLDIARAFTASEGDDDGVTAFIAWIETGERRNGSLDAVDLATFHRAKGLEWPVVFVTGLERGLVPISWATHTSALAEEQRLLHVALTRAADELHCSWARTRAVGARRVARDPSPWLGDLEHAARSFAGADTALSDRVSGMRQALTGAAAPAPRRRSRTR